MSVVEREMLTEREDFIHRYSRRYRTPQPDNPFPNKPAFRNPDYAREMQRRGLTKLKIRIKAVGVFDTVGMAIQSCSMPIL